MFRCGGQLVIDYYFCFSLCFGYLLFNVLCYAVCLCIFYSCHVRRRFPSIAHLLLPLYAFFAFLIHATFGGDFLQSRAFFSPSMRYFSFLIHVVFRGDFLRSRAFFSPSTCFLHFSLMSCSEEISFDRAPSFPPLRVIFIFNSCHVRKRFSSIARLLLPLYVFLAFLIHAAFRGDFLRSHAFFSPSTRFFFAFLIHAAFGGDFLPLCILFHARAALSARL